MGETTRCFGNKKVRKMCFSPPFCACLASKVRRCISGTCHVSRRLHVKFRANSFRFAGVISEKMTSYDRNMPSAYKEECLPSASVHAVTGRRHRSLASSIIRWFRVQTIGHTLTMRNSFLLFPWMTVIPALA